MSLHSPLLCLYSRCFKLLKEKHSLFTAVTKSKLQNQRLECINEKLQDLCRLSQQRLKLSLKNHDASSAQSENHVNDLVGKFRTTIDDIQSKISNHNDMKLKQETENDELSRKIAEFREHSKLRTEHYATQLRAKGLELQLADARLGKLS